MKTSFKDLIVGIALLCAGVGQAAVVLADGTTLYNGTTVSASATWSFSRDLTHALEIPKGAEVGVYGEAWKETIFYPTLDEFGQPNQYARHVIHAPVSALTTDDASGEVRAAASTGGTTWKVSQTLAAGVVGGQAEIGNLDARYQADGSVNIYGVINGQRLSATSGVSYTGLLFTVQASDVEGSISFAGAPGFYAQTTLHKLALTDEGLDALTRSFGLISASLMHYALRSTQSDFGDLTLSVTSLAPIPEPSAFVLMGCGLFGLVILRRRRSI